MGQLNPGGAGPGHSRTTRRLRAVALSVGILFLGLKGSETSRHFQVFGRLVGEVQNADGLVALTFDDGPNPPFTGRALDILMAHGVRATFFILGCNAEAGTEYLARIVREGHELGNHGYWHSAMTFKLPRVIESDIKRTDRLIEQAGGRQPIHFRAPYGRKLLIAPWVFSRLGKVHVMWSVEPDPSEFTGATAQTIAASVLGQVRGGSIILLHDGGGDRTPTIDSLRLILKGLAARGLKPVTVSELLRKSGN